MIERASIRRAAELRLRKMWILGSHNQGVSRKLMMLSLSLAGYEQRSGESDLKFYARFVKQTEDIPTTAQKPKSVKTKKLQTPRHFRQDEIDALPVLISMPWDGKGVFWRQGSADFVGKGE